jgi:hypothetical protein
VDPNLTSRCRRCLGPLTPSSICAPCEREQSIATGAYALEDELFRTAAQVFGVALDDVELILTRPAGLWKIALRIVPDAEPVAVSAPSLTQLDALRSLAAALHAVSREVA